MSAMSDPFGARTPLDGHGLDYFRIARLDEAGVADTSRLPYTRAGPARDGAAQRRVDPRHRGRRARARELAGAGAGHRVGGVPAGARDPAGLHRRARRSSTSPRCAARWRARATTPSGVDPLVPADLVIDHSVQVDAFGSPVRVRAQHRARVRAQRRALRAAALGAGRVRRLPRRAAGHGHRAPGQPRAPRPRGAGRGDGVALPDTLVGTDSHTTMIDALGDPRLGRRRHRGRGRDARRAARAADADRRSACEFRGALPHRRHRHRPRADADRDAAQARRGRQVRRVLRRRPVGAVDPRPRDALEHGAGVRRDRRRRSRSTPRRCATCDADRPRRRVRRWSRRTRKAQGMWRSDGDATPDFTELLVLDLDAVEPSLAGPRRPQDRVAARQRAGVASRDAFPREPYPVRLAERGAGARRRHGVDRGARGRRRDRPRRGRDRRDHVAARTPRTRP